MPFGTEKLEWFGYLTVKNFLKICLFVLPVMLLTNKQGYKVTNKLRDVLTKTDDQNNAPPAVAEER